MKKITAFFMALMPIFVTALLFICGLIVKNVTHVEVRGVEISQNSLDIQLKDDSKQETFQLDSNVLPKNATNPEVYWTSSNEDVVKVDNTGLVSSIGYGEAFIYVTSKENPTIQDKCKVEVWDDRIHKISIDNKYEASYLGYGTSIKLQTHTIPSGGRVKSDPTLIYSTTSDQIIVAQDGTVTSVGESDVDAVVNITTKPQEGQPEIKQEVKVSIKPGVTEIALKQQTKTVTSYKKYNFAQEIVSFPDNNVPASDYTYISSDESIAQVSNEQGSEGVVTFNQKNAPVEITATYKRNTKLSIKKQISSTCDYLNKVYFNMYQAEFDWNSLPEGGLVNIGYGTYPTSTDNTHIKFYSTDKSVVTPIYNESQKKWQFKVNSVGIAILVAVITLDEQGHTAFDTCVVNVKNTATNLFKQAAVTTNSYYYSLRDNLIDDYDLLLSHNQTIEWSIISGEDYATLDTTNWLVHFKPNVESADNVEIKAMVGNQQFTFTLLCNPPKEIKLDSESKTYKIKVGNKYLFESGYITGLSEDAFNLEKDSSGNVTSFVPKAGGKYNATLSISLFSKKDITLIVEEAPIGIKYKDGYKVMSHTAEKIVKTRELLTPTLIPSTATDSDGSSYAIQIQYYYDDKEVIVADDTLTFKEDSVVIAMFNVVGVNLETDYLGIHSTCGWVGKFTLKDGTTPIDSGQTISLSVNETKTLLLDKTYLSEQISELITTQFKIESLNGNNITECSTRWTGDNVAFDIKAIATGSDTLHVYTPTFSFFINVNVAEKITDLGLYYHSTAIDSANSMLTVTPTFKLIASGRPITAETVLSATISSSMGSTSTVTIDQVTKAVSVQLNDGKGDYVLTINGTNGLTGPISKQWKFKYSTDLTSVKVGLLEGDTTVKPQGTQGTLFLGSNNTSLIATIVINNGVAIVPQQFYTYFKLKIDDTKLSPTFNKFTIENIPSPTTATPGYEKDIQLVYDDGSGAGEQTVGLPYHISRELVSKIVLPDHDNNDQTDKKGLQKVHVYGNKTFQSLEEGLINYYKLPINLYDFENKLIKGDAKKKAYEQLVKIVMVGKTVKENASQYLAYTTTQFNPEGFVAVTFDPSGFYSTKEMYDDAFANEATHKNFTVDFHTHTALADAHYMFVTVDGVNVYCQEGLLDNQQQRSTPVILQVDFAKEDVPFSKTNVPLDKIILDWTYVIYGNGHTMNFTKQYEKSLQQEDYNYVRAHSIFNTVMQGVDSKIATPQTKNTIFFRFQMRSSYFLEVGRNQTHYCRYCNFNYWTHGLDVDWMECQTSEGNDYYVKNCIFHDNFTAGAYTRVSPEHGNFYLEDSVFFNAASFAITNKKDGHSKLKGFIDIYNFKTGHEIFDNIEGYKLPWLWDHAVKKYAEEYKVIQYNHAGQQVINSCMGNIMGGSFYFFKGLDAQGKPIYEKSDHGSELAAKHVFNFINFPTTFIGEIGMWATVNPIVEPECPSYNDEFNEQDQIRVTFYETNIKKVTRKYTWF